MGFQSCYDRINLTLHCFQQIINFCMQGIQCLQFLLKLLVQIAFPLVNVRSGHPSRHIHSGLTPNSRCCCLEVCEELGAFGSVVCTLGCLIERGCDISVRFRYQICKPFTAATSCDSDPLSLVPGWPSTHLSAVC